MAAALNDVSRSLGAIVATGTVSSRSTGSLGWLLALIAGVPVRGSTMARLEIRGSDHSDVWTRTFGRRRQVSRVRRVDGIVEEEFGRLTFEFTAVALEQGHLELERTRYGRRSSGPALFALRSSTIRRSGRLHCRIEATLLGGRIGRLCYEVHLRDHPGGELP